MKNVCTVLFLFVPLFLSAQREADTWYFGDKAGLRFLSGAPVPLTNSNMSVLEGAASISDGDGNLLFYTNGVNVWDANGNIMPHGTTLSGNTSTSQTLIVPQPGNPNRYYIFYADAEGGPNGMRYCVVDMELNGGMGDVITAEKNIILFETATEKIAAVNHCNKKDVWIMTMNYATDEFYAYLLSDAGLSAPVISSAGTLDPTCCNTLKFSPDGKWVAYTNILSSGGDDSRLYQFDNSTGIATFQTVLPRNVAAAEQLYGISFSPDNSKLYISSAYNYNASGVYNALYQYDMTAADIAASRVVICKEMYPGSAIVSYPFSTLQNAPNGKMYLARWGMYSPLDTLGVINSPNMPGLSCDFDKSGVSLSGRNCQRGLPNFNESYFNQSPEEPSCEVEEDTTTEVTTSVFNNNSVDFNVYPAITTGMIYITTAVDMISDVEVFSISGEQVYAGNSVDARTGIDLGNAAEGIYFVRVSAGAVSKVKKITIVR